MLLAPHIKTYFYSNRKRLIARVTDADLTILATAPRKQGHCTREPTLKLYFHLRSPAVSHG